MSLFHQLDAVGRQAKQLRAAIQQAVEALPPNHRAVSLGRRCQAVMLSDLRHGWDPAMHDFSQQYRMVSEQLGRLHVEDVHRGLQRIVDSGLVQQRPGHPRTFRLHPAVKQHLATLLQGDAAPESEASHVPVS